jgi:hypothetical protein
VRRRWRGERPVGGWASSGDWKTGKCSRVVAMADEGDPDFEGAR